MKSDTLARRITWAIVATVALFVGLMAVLAYVVMYQQEDELANQIVQIEMRRLIGRLQQGQIDLARQPIEMGPGIEAWVDGAVGGARIPAALRGLSAGPHEITTSTRVLHVINADSDAGHLAVVYDATANEKRVRQFGIILLALWAVCVAAGYWLARLTAGIVAGRMQAVAERIANWDPDITQEGKPVQAGSDEADRLLEAFNRMQDRIDRSIAREREFTANLSHEVRTPLAALRTDIEMVSLDAATTNAQRKRLARMTLAIDEIDATIKATRAMSRARLLPLRQDFSLHSLVEDVCKSLGARAAAAQLRVCNEVAAETRLRVDRYALQIVLRNLIGNGIDHAAPAELSVCFADQSLQISDNGPGIGKAEQPLVFDRFHHGRLSDQLSGRAETVNDEHGLGLAIARRVCDQQGWLISMESETSGQRRGTRFSVFFDENST
jgi:signal transduction histidine kinase